MTNLRKPGPPPDEGAGQGVKIRDLGRRSLILNPKRLEALWREACFNQAALLSSFQFRQLLLQLLSLS